jgi:hypothetical protein
MSGMPQFFGKPAPGRFDAIIHQLSPFHHKTFGQPQFGEAAAYFTSGV